jgi:hypothetical protein
MTSMENKKKLSHKVVISRRNLVEKRIIKEKINLCIRCNNEFVKKFFIKRKIMIK